jgi:hypothetical protein
MFVIADLVNHVGNHHTIGNHFFQFATAYAYAKNNSRKLILPLFNLTNSSFPLFKYHGWYEKMGQYAMELPEGDIFSHIETNNQDYTSIPVTDKTILLLQGYFQKPLYFKDHEKEIKAILDPSDEIKQKCQQKWGFLFREKNCVIVHARRTDYIKLASIHNPLPPTYYLNAFKEIEKHVENPFYILVSDDSSFWSTFTVPKPHLVIEESDPAIALYFMTRFENYIIANSTFSWWGAYLSANEQKRVIAPKTWFGPDGSQNWQDIYDEGWIIVPQ